MTRQVVGGLEIIGIRDPGLFDKERLLLRALEPVQLEYYIAINTKSSGESLTILNDKIFWFPSKLINMGEFVRLYSKNGVYTKTEAKFGDQPAIYHDFYWGKNSAILDNTTANAFTVFKLNYWNTAYSSA